MPNLAKMKALLEDAKAAYKAQFTGGFYHGSPSPNIKAFDPLKNTDPMKLETPGVTFVTRDPDFAESFLPGSERGGYKSGATMYPVNVNLGKANLKVSKSLKIISIKCIHTKLIHRI